MNFLCPACRSALPSSLPTVVTCPRCGVEVDIGAAQSTPGQARLWPETDLTGEQLSTYRLTERVDATAAGTLYLAEGLLGPCLVKVLAPTLAADPALREALTRQALALKALEHPNLVRVIEQGQERGYCWFAMEGAPGPTLRERLTQGPLSAAEVERLAADLLAALGALHDAALLHGDLQPAHVVMTPTGARLRDFAIARAGAERGLAETAARLRGLPYVAPEHQLGPGSVQADLYGLGAVLCEALTGAVPGDRPLPRTTAAFRLIEALLQPRPARRPASARAALKLLEPRRRTGLALAAAAASVALAVGAVVGGSGALERRRPASSLHPVALRPIEVVAAPPSVATASPPIAAAAEVPIAAARAAEPLPAGFDQAPAPVARGPARTVQGALTVEGGLTDVAVIPVLQHHQRELTECYEQQLRTAPELAGMVSVHFTIERAGRQGRASGQLLRSWLGALPGPGKKPRLRWAPDGGEPGGLVIEVSVAESTLRSTEAIVCMLERIRSWRFPEPKGEPATVLVAWAFVAGPDTSAGARAPVPPRKPKAVTRPQSKLPSPSGEDG